MPALRAHHRHASSRPCASNPRGGKHAFFMPSSQGPVPLRPVHGPAPADPRARGLGDEVAILAPASNNAYQGLDSPMRRTLFKAIACADILLKAQCKVRPYEVNARRDRSRGRRERPRRVGKALEKDGDIRAALRDGDRRRSPPSRPRVRASRWSASWARSTCATTSSPTRTSSAPSSMFGGEAWMLPDHRLDPLHLVARELQRGVPVDHPVVGQGRHLHHLPLDEALGSRS